MRNLAFAVLLFAGAASASSVYPLSLHELRAKADVVVHVRVVAQRVVVEARGPVTYTTLTVLDADKGAKSHDALVVYQPGDATRGDRWIDGAHRFHVGDELVFFGERFVHAGKHVVIAMAPGAGVVAVTSTKGARAVYEAAR